MRTFNDFTRIYPLSKTLRFELVPIGRTKESIAESGILEQDQHRADSYVKVKKIIDEYHKAFIERVLATTKLPYESTGNKNSLEEFYTFYMCGSKELLTTVQNNLRKLIADSFKKDDSYKRIDKQELIKEDLVNFVSKEEDKELIAEFKNFTTYFTGYHENRKNMYVADKKSTAIAYRLIHENLPRFINNMTVFEKIASSPIAAEFSKIYTDFEEYLNVKEIAEMFKLDYFNEILTQEQIHVYNLIIGGCPVDNREKAKGLNEYINLYNQQQKNKSNRLPKLKPLYKQILSDKVPIPWLEGQFESDEQLLATIKDCFHNLNNRVFNRQNETEHSLKDLLLSLKEYNLEKIYVKNDAQLSAISQRIFGNFNVITNCLINKLKNEVPQENESDGDFEERCSKILKSQDSISINTINCAIKGAEEDYTYNLHDYFAALGTFDKNGTKKENLFEQIEKTYAAAKDLLNTPYPQQKSLTQDEKSVELIKNLFDTIKDLQRFVKPLLGTGNEVDKDDKFYDEFSALWDELELFTPLYNNVRDWLTRKPYNTKKIKLHFENNGNILNGWVDSKTEKSDNGTQYGGYIFRKKNSIDEYDYFLGISANTKLFRNEINTTPDTPAFYERLNYYQLKSKTIYGKAYKGNYTEETKNIIESILSFAQRTCDRRTVDGIKEHIKSKSLTTNSLLNYVKQNLSYDDVEKLFEDNYFKTANKKLINSLQTTLSSLTRIPKAIQLSVKEYQLFSDIMHDVDELCNEKLFSYYRVDEQEFDEAINSDKKRLFLFKITNKDLSFADSHSKGKREKRGTENLHTMYFKALMSGEQSVFDIGSAAIYYREHSIDVTSNVEEKGHHYEELKDKFSYPIISNRRYCYDKFLLHMSITQNYQSNNCTPSSFNETVNEYIREKTEQYIIGIDRGERHLLYLTMIDSKGNIVKQYSLNEIINTYNGKEYRTDYHSLLSEREKERMDKRQSWKNIQNIKDLKEGYLSAVIHKIAELMVEYNAIVVLEDLNMEFKRSRLKVESSVYQKFEKMLIDKLNYLADKKKRPLEAGGILNAYQLTNKFESFNKLGKQSGFLFYIPAWNTSKIDPVTGFVNLFDTRYESIDKTKEFFNKFKSIRYNNVKDWFEFEFDYTPFTTKAEGTRTQWTVCTVGKRIKNLRDEKQNSQWTSEEVVPTQLFKDLFSGKAINIGSNLKEEIGKQNDAKFFKELLDAFKLTLQMRNSFIGEEIDYLQSPVADKNGIFYNSNECNDSLPQNADANGAYNIARKGLWIVQQIKTAKDLKKLKLAISNKEWLQFAQEKPYLKA